MSNRHVVVDMLHEGTHTLLEITLPEDLTDNLEINGMTQVIEDYVKNELVNLHGAWKKRREFRRSFVQWLNFHGHAEIVQPIEVEIPVEGG